MLSRVLTSLWLVAFLGCASLPEPKTCAVIGASLGGAGGAVGGAKSDRKHDGDSIMGYGALGILVGGGVGYLTCAVLGEGEPETAEREIEPAPPTEPAAEPLVAQSPEPPPLQPATPPDPCEQTFTFPGVNFEFDRSDLRPAGRAALSGVADRLGECSSVQVRIVGHTDWIGSEAYNLGLSRRRAQAVLDFLVARGLSPARLATEGRGESEPVATNETAEGRAANRRVELHPSSP